MALCLGDKEEADDIAQEALLKAYLSLEGYTERGKFISWIYKIAHNIFLDRAKRGRYATLSIDGASVGEVSALTSNNTSDSGFKYQELYDAISKLAPKERTSILLYYIKGFSIKEIGKIVGCSETAVKKQLSRGREHLKGLLGESY